MRPFLLILSFLFVPLTYALSRQEASIISTMLATNRALWAAARELPVNAPLRQSADIFEHLCQQTQGLSPQATRLTQELRRIARSHSQGEKATDIFRTVRRVLSQRLDHGKEPEKVAASEIASAYKKMETDSLSFLANIASEDKGLASFLETRLRAALSREN
ncbi:MAG: hypothetical protein HYW48_10300 [Deltaproteobacteria bacterium]|nr:hypothetical protein [Deltaproteobacteria bacterium]